jgi:hypothetical protein
MNQELGYLNYEELMRNKNAHESYLLLKEKILSATERYIPRKKVKSNNDPPWFTQEIRTLINLRQQSYRRLKIHPTEAHRQDHIRTCRAVKRTIRSTKRNKEIAVAAQAKLNPKSFYKYVNDRRLKKDAIGPLVDPDGTVRTDTRSKAQILNTYFTSVFTREDLAVIPQPRDLNFHETLSNDVFTVEEVEKELSLLNPYKSTGPDGLTPRILKEMAVVISKPLAIIFNRSLATGTVPEDWKQANVTPIFKKGNKQLPNNYRPISLTSISSKIMERLLKVRITNHLNEQHLMNDTQHGFREKRSCLTNLLDFFGEVNRIYDGTQALDLVYLDFQKAFDKVPHERLMAKIESHGIRGNYSRWIRNWLTGRSQRVAIDEKYSDWTNVTSGVPQGSVLGPLLFIIYINDLDHGIISKINKFADDTKLCHRAFTERDRITIQEDINRLLQWSETWQMSFNVEKCSVMHVGKNNQHFQYSMNNVIMESVEQQRDLGVIITNDLKHEKQVEKSVKNASRMLGFIARTFEYKSKNIMIPLYKALVRPHLEYAVQLWSPNLRKDINKMEKIQRKATKMIPGLRNLSYEQRLQQLELISLEQRRLRGQLIETYKYLNGFNDASLEGLFERDINVRTRNNGHKLIRETFRTSKAQNSFPFNIPSAWNLLPESIVSACTVNTFKNRLDEYWKQRPPSL